MCSRSKNTRIVREEGKTRVVEAVRPLSVPSKERKVRMTVNRVTALVTAVARRKDFASGYARDPRVT